MKRARALRHWCTEMYVMWCNVKLTLTSSNWTCAPAARAELYTQLAIPLAYKGLKGRQKFGVLAKKQLQICAKEDYTVENSQPGYWHTVSVQPTFCNRHSFLFGSGLSERNPTFTPMTTLMLLETLLCVSELLNDLETCAYTHNKRTTNPSNLYLYIV